MRQQRGHWHGNPSFNTLARYFATLYLQRFLTGNKDAGNVMLEARQALLAINNPLGLMFNQYAPAELRLVRQNAEKPAASECSSA